MPVRIRATPVDTRENFFYAISPLASFLIQLGLLGGKEDPHTRLPLCSHSFSEFSRSRYIYRYRYIFICRIICLSLRLWEDLIRFVFVTCNYSENRILVHNFLMECSGKGRESEREKKKSPRKRTTPRPSVHVSKAAQIFSRRIFAARTDRILVFPAIPSVHPVKQAVSPFVPSVVSLSVVCPPPSLPPPGKMNTFTT